MPEAARRGTLDSLSALAALIRQVQRTGRCKFAARVYDGRRLTEMTARTEGLEMLTGGRGEWSGRATRCRFEGRLVAGFHRDNNGEEARRRRSGPPGWARPSQAPPVLHADRGADPLVRQPDGAAVGGGAGSPRRGALTRRQAGSAPASRAGRSAGAVATGAPWAIAGGP